MVLGEGNSVKGFTRAETRFSLCGLNCALCSMHLGGYCPGCGGGAGNQSCAIARCSLEIPLSRIGTGSRILPGFGNWDWRPTLPDWGKSRQF